MAEFDKTNRDPENSIDNRVLSEVEKLNSEMIISDTQGRSAEDIVKNLGKVRKLLEKLPSGVLRGMLILLEEEEDDESEDLRKAISLFAARWTIKKVLKGRQK